MPTDETDSATEFELSAVPGRRTDVLHSVVGGAFRLNPRPKSEIVPNAR